MRGRFTRYFAGSSMLAVVLLVGSGDTFQAETRPVSGVVGFETGLHLLASFDALHRTAPVGVFWGDGTQSPGLVQCPEERTRCNVYGTHAYPEAGHYTIEISYRRPGLFTPRESVFSTAEISAVGDFVILSIGDSVASGEGLPDVNYLSRSHSEPNQGFWQDPASNYSPVDLPTPLVPEDNELRVPCHRSAAAGPALAARQVGATNPVTFVHLACSGAVVFHTFSPAEPSEETRRGALDRQLRVARQRLDRIDVLLISGGANNMTFRKRGPLGFHNGTIGVGFGSVVTRCFNPAKWPCSGDEEFRQDISDSIEGNAGRTETDDDGVVYSFPGLDRLYADLDSVIHCINPQDGSPEKNCTDKHIPKLVLITEFFDPTHDQHGEFPSLVNCPEDVTIGPREWEYLHESVVKRLNHHVRTSPWKAVVGMEAEFLKHGYCAQGDRWVLRLGDSKATQNDTHGTGHPTSIGQDVYQRHIYHALIRLNPPITTAAAASEGTPYEFGTPAGRDVEVTLSARNPVRESAVGRTFYSVNRADCAPGSLSGCTLYTEPFVLSASGTYTIRFFSENASGQGWERVQSVDVRIDRAAAGGCTTIQPGPSWVCVDGGWLPPDHPLAGPAPPPAACTTPQPAPHWVCVNGGWVPPDHPLARGGSG